MKGKQGVAIVSKQEPLDEVGGKLRQGKHPMLMHFKRFYWLYIFLIPGLFSIFLFI